MTPIAVDTNILVRLATGDSEAQRAAAEALLAEHAVFVPLTVILETEWVLRSRYGYSASQFVEFVQWLLQDPNVELAEPKWVRAALDLHSKAWDFADALHVNAAAGRPFATFDRPLVRRARAERLPIRAMGVKEKSVGAEAKE